MLRVPGDIVRPRHSSGVVVRPLNFTVREISICASLRLFQHFDGGGSGSGRSSLDRKSTRLNSSHLVISYAVFCLKKKNYSGTVDVLDLPATSASGGGQGVVP